MQITEVILLVSAAVNLAQAGVVVWMSKKIRVQEKILEPIREDAKLYKLTRQVLRLLVKRKAEITVTLVHGETRSRTLEDFLRGVVPEILE